MKKDGTRIDVALTISPLVDEKGGCWGPPPSPATSPPASGPRRVCGRRESRHRAILDASLDAIVTIDERGIIESINPATERLFGYAAAELIGSNVSILMPSPHHEMHDAYLANYLQTGQRKIIGIGREVTGRRKDGTLFPMDLSVSEIVLNGRRMFLGLVHDVTERKRAEDALRSARDELEIRVQQRTAELTAANEQLKQERYLFNTLMDYLPHNIYFKDAANRFLRINRAMAGYFGLARHGRGGRARPIATSSPPSTPWKRWPTSRRSSAAGNRCSTRRRRRPGPTAARPGWPPRRCRSTTRRGGSSAPSASPATSPNASRRPKPCGRRRKRPKRPTAPRAPSWPT